MLLIELYQLKWLKNYIKFNCYFGERVKGNIGHIAEKVVVLSARVWGWRGKRIN